MKNGAAYVMMQDHGADTSFVVTMISLKDLLYCLFSCILLLNCMGSSSKNLLSRPDSFFKIRRPVLGGFPYVSCIWKERNFGISSWQDSSRTVVR